MLIDQPEAHDTPELPVTGWSRRAFVGHGALGGIGLMTFMVNGCAVSLTPGDARKARVPFRILGSDEASTLEALGDVLLPGSAANGLAHFIDHQLSGPPADNMLMIRYLGVQPPFTDFYRNGLRGLDAAARSDSAMAFADLGADAASRLVGSLAAGQLAAWSGPPAGLFYFVLRNDAIDVTYGTPAGFAALGIPYMAHIEPPSRWGE
jgi:hypothetical protein